MFKILNAALDNFHDSSNSQGCNTSAGVMNKMENLCHKL